MLGGLPDMLARRCRLAVPLWIVWLWLQACRHPMAAQLTALMPPVSCPSRPHRDEKSCTLVNTTQDLSMMVDEQKHRVEEDLDLDVSLPACLPACLPASLAPVPVGGVFGSGGAGLLAEEGLTRETICLTAPTHCLEVLTATAGGTCGRAGRRAAQAAAQGDQAG